MISLTARQQDALRFIARFQAEKGYSPSRREIGAALGLTALASIHRLIMGLVDRGAVRILAKRTRAIEVLVPVPMEEAGAAGAVIGGFGLTERQQDALRFITGYIERNGIPPSVREIAVGIGTAPEATNYIHRILIALEQAGAIMRSPGQDRGIAVLRPLPIPRAPDGEPLRFIRIGEAG